MAEAPHLAFRVMRLNPPTFPSQGHTTFDVLHDLEATPSVSPDSLPLDHPFASRLHCSSGDRGPSAVLATPASFGAVYLGQSFRACVVLCNLDTAPVSGLAITIEIQTERGKTVLHGGAPAPLLTLAGGAQHSMLITHDIKEVGPHTLTCAATFAAPDGSRRYLPQVFRFAATNPLVVRTKQRTVGEAILLEVVLTSAVHTPFFLTRHTFLPSPPFAAEEVSPAPPGAAGTTLGPLSAALAQRPLITPNGGTYGLLYRLTLQRGKGGGALHDPSAASIPLGKVDLEWAGPMGEVARLQTQTITAVPGSVPRVPPDLSLHLEALPPRLEQERPFLVTLGVHNAGRRASGPLLVSWRGSATQGTLVASGAHAAPLPGLAPGARASVALRLLPLAAGQQLLAGIQLSDERTGALLDALPPQELFVHPV